MLARSHEGQIRQTRREPRDLRHPRLLLNREGGAAQPFRFYVPRMAGIRGGKPPGQIAQAVRLQVCCRLPREWELIGLAHALTTSGAVPPAIRQMEARAAAGRHRGNARARLEPADRNAPASAVKTFTAREFSRQAAGVHAALR